MTSAFHRLTRTAAKDFNADIILIDVGPNFGAINRSALISADAVVVPTGTRSLFHSRAPEPRSDIAALAGGMGRAKVKES